MSLRFIEATLLVSVLVLCAIPRANARDSVQVGREVGRAFPQIDLPTLHGKRPLALSGFRGKKVLLIEFASW